MGYPLGGRGEMSTAQIKAIIAQLQDECPVETIALSGGEPLLRKDLPEILAYMRERNIDPMIITNGTLLTPRRVAATLVGGTYEVTLLSHKPEVHDRLAGRPGAWQATINGMNNVRKAGGNLIVAFVATRLNFQDLSWTAQLALALGAVALMYNRLNLSRHNLNFADQLLPTPQMIEQNLDTLEEIGGKYNLPVSVSVVCEPCVVNTQGYKHLHFGWCPLAGENSYFTIDPLGNVRLCNHSPIILGNLHQTRFSEIYFNHPYVQLFRETLPQGCENCPVDLRQMCGGGCKAAGEQCYGSLTRVDPFVALNRQTA
jgi:radical SAM protein with 4Fe4S-binding SPASM domain